MGKKLSWLSSLTLLKHVEKKKYSTDFKPALLLMKINIE